jgi:dTDP-4-dehydrorhamnose reductase
MKRAVILGAKGMLGYAFGEYYSRKGSRPTCLSRAEFDIARDPIDRLERWVHDADCVINCAGVIKPMIEKTPIEDVIRVNSIFPRNLARLCETAGTRAVHITTDCAYSGAKGGYTELDYFDADDVYGTTKNAGDTADNMVLRTSILGEEKGQGRSLLEWARSQSGKKVKGFLNHWWNGVTTVYLAEIVDTILAQGLYRKGIFHVHSPNTVSKYELLSIINDVYQLRLEVEPVEVQPPCDRSLASVHSLSKQVCVKPVRQQVEEMRRFFSERSPSTG